MSGLPSSSCSSQPDISKFQYHSFSKLIPSLLTLRESNWNLCRIYLWQQIVSWRWILLKAQKVHGLLERNDFHSNDHEWCHCYEFWHCLFSDNSWCKCFFKWTGLLCVHISIELKWKTKSRVMYALFYCCLMTTVTFSFFWHFSTSGEVFSWKCQWIVHSIVFLGQSVCQYSKSNLCRIFFLPCNFLRL